LDQITLYALYAAINIRCVALKAPLLTKEGWMSKASDSGFDRRGGFYVTKRLVE